jgi:hypothetical protein
MQTTEQLTILCLVPVIKEGSIDMTFVRVRKKNSLHG